MLLLLAVVYVMPGPAGRVMMIPMWLLMPLEFLSLLSNRTGSGFSEAKWLVGRPRATPLDPVTAITRLAFSGRDLLIVR